MCKSILEKIPLILVILSLCWSYYTYIVLYCFYVLSASTKKIVYSLIFHLIFVMLLWSLIQTVLCTHKRVPEEYRLSPEDHNRLMTYKEEEANTILTKLIEIRTLEVFTLSTNNQIRYCNICHQIKPDRVHHCSTCNQCILKMDHHCPWVNNCIGYSNYKKFILFLLYTIGICCFSFGTLSEEVVQSLYQMRQNVTKLQIGIGYIMSALIGTFVLILFVYHIGLLLKNETTLESLRDINFAGGNKTYNVGCWNNFAQIFGENCCLWWFPVHSSVESGLEFPTRNLIGSV